jgi:hypothetical protein
MGMAQYVDLTARRRVSPQAASTLAAAQVALGLLVAAAGAIHLYLYFDYFHRVHVVGALFLVNAAAGLLTGAMLLVSRHPFVLLAAGGYAVATLVGFVISTRWGLFGYRETFWGSWQEAAGGIELVALFLSGLLLVRR